MIKLKLGRHTLLAWLGLFLSSIAGTGQAHESRPFYVDITEQRAGFFKVIERVPSSVPEFNRPHVELPSMCKIPAGASKSLKAPLRHYECASVLSGEALNVVFPLMNPSISTLIRLELLNGQIHTARLGPKESRWQIPAEETFSQVAEDYTILGVEHILKGYDHLLFLACLLFIAGRFKTIVITVSGFTIAHSFTLVAAALGWVALPVPAIEAVIALSIVFLARELILNRRDSLTWQKPVLVSMSFGLLHGFGFAAVLQDIGLPQTELPAALLFFNVGVEVGQLLFVGAAALIFVLAQKLIRLSDERNVLLQKTNGALVGCLASFWLFERLAGF